MIKTELELLLEKGLTTRQMAKELVCSQTNVRYWLKKHGLKTKLGPRGKFPKDLIRPRKCVCGETDPSKFYGNKRNTCGKCHNKYTLQKGKEKRKFALEYLGGKCTACGYDKHTCSLDIHHTDPAKKDVAFSSMRGWCVERLRLELKSCTLLCKNCHAALHCGEIDSISGS